MKSFANVVSEIMVLVIDTSTGEEVRFFKSDFQFETALTMIKEGAFEAVFDLDAKSVLSDFFITDDDGVVSVSIENGRAYITLHSFNDMKVEMPDSLSNKIIKMHSQGFDCQAMVNFISNLYDNPSQVAISELYLFIESCDLPITEDGHFIAYKIVNDDYTDCHTGKINNRVGETPIMPRGLVDDNRNNTCSRGLHFCSKSYLRSFGGADRRCMIVKINPADVVSIPSDYNNAKGRTWTYEVVGEIEGDWLSTLPNKDYTDKAVVDSNGSDYVDIDNDWENSSCSTDDDDWENSSCSFDDDDDLGDFTPAPIICPVIASIHQNQKYVEGYKKGFVHGKLKSPAAIIIDFDDYDYSEGYSAGYKDGKNKKGNKFK